MRSRKQSDSPSHYDREIRPRRRLALVTSLGDHEKRIRQMTDERWQRRIQPLLNTSSRPSDDFAGCTE